MKALWLAAFALPMAALAQAPPASPTDEIVVTAIKGQWSLEGKRIRAAQAAFLAGRERYAPGSRMFFQVTPKGGRLAEGLKLTLHKGDDAEDIPLDGDLHFTLPLLDSDDWRLAANRTPAEMGVRLWIFSPGSTEADRRLGDLRLYCRVGWAFLRDRFNLVERAGFDAVGGCDSRHIQFNTAASHPLSAASVSAPGIAERSLPITNGIRYRLPIADKDLPDAARIHLTYR